MAFNFEHDARGRRVVEWASLIEAAWIFMTLGSVSIRKGCLTYYYISFSDLFLPLLFYYCYLLLVSLVACYTTSSSILSKSNSTILLFQRVHVSAVGCSKLTEGWMNILSLIYTMLFLLFVSCLFVLYSNENYWNKFYILRKQRGVMVNRTYYKKNK